MNWDDVRVFLAVARAGQFVAAARGLKVDHATVARRVTALETALNARLVDRRTTGVLLTGAGTASWPPPRGWRRPSSRRRPS